MSKRPTSSYVIAISSVLLAALAAGQPIFFGYGDLVETLLWLLFALSWIWLGYVIPSVEIQGEYLEIVNPFRLAKIGIGAIADVDTRFALKVSGKFGSISAWAAPAPGRLRHRSHTTEDFRALGLKSGELVRPGDMPSTITGSIALQIKRMQNSSKDLPSVSQITPNYLGIALAVVPTLLLLAHYLS